MALALDYQDAVEQRDRGRQRSILEHAEAERNKASSDARTTNALLSLMSAGLAGATPVPEAYGALGPQLANAGQAGLQTMLTLSREDLMRDREARLAESAQTRALQGSQRIEQSQARLAANLAKPTRQIYEDMGNGQEILVNYYVDRPPEYARGPQGEYHTRAKVGTPLYGENDISLVTPGPRPEFSGGVPGMPAAPAPHVSIQSTGQRPASAAARPVVRDAGGRVVVVDPGSGVARDVVDREGKVVPGRAGTAERPISERWVTLEDGQTRLRQEWADGQVTFAVGPSGEPLSQPRSPQIVTGEDQVYLLPPGAVPPGPGQPGPVPRPFPGIPTGVRPPSAVPRPDVRQFPGQGPVVVDPGAGTSRPVLDEAGNPLPPPPAKPEERPYVGADPFLTFRGDTYVASPQSGGLLEKMDAAIAELGGPGVVTDQQVQRMVRDLQQAEKNAAKWWGDPIKRAAREALAPPPAATPVPAAGGPVAGPLPAAPPEPPPPPIPAGPTVNPSQPVPSATPVPYDERAENDLATLYGHLRSRGLNTREKIFAYLTGPEWGLSPGDAQVVMGQIRTYAQKKGL